MVANEREKFKEYVTNLVKEYWEREQRAYLLTALGAEIAREQPGYRRIIGVKLRPFLEFLMQDRLHFIKHNEKLLVFGVVPIEVELPTNTDELLTKSPRPQRIMFDRKFWNAFAKPALGGKRVVEFERSGDEIVSFNVRNLSAKQLVPENAIEIPPEQIVSSELPPGPARSQNVYDKIEAWLEAHSLNPAAFRSQTPYQPDRRPQLDIHEFVQAFGILDKSDQQRIQIPLDIVLKLLSRQ